MEKESAKKANIMVKKVTDNEKEEAEDLLTQAVCKTKAINNKLKS